jgi:putative DNA primase/helicase
LIIAVANSRKEKVWKNIEISWDDFLNKVSNTHRTAESVLEYKKLPKPKQDEAKDVGGFVGGRLKDGKRKTGFVEYRSMLTLDMDYADGGLWEQITMFYDFTCCIYSTHKHTPEKPRLRLIIPLLRNVTADEYTAVSRMVASDIGIEQFDDTTYEPTRLMYWPSTSSDGVFVFEKQDGTLLDPDKLLSRYKDWHDSSQWPVSSRQTSIVKHSISKQADPLEKEGLIGVFCRTYTIGEAIDKFLSDVYSPSLIEGRFDYIPADSTAGVLVYDDKFAFSHHATDPACSKLCNAFDLVRIHKFGELDGKADEGAVTSKLPSFKAMQELCIVDENVKRQLALKRREQATTDFTPTDDEDWQTRLDVGKNGEVLNTLKNLITILECDPKLKSIAFNQLSDGMEIKDEVPWKHPGKFWRDADDAQLISYIDLTYGSFTARNYDIAVTKVTDDRSYHPIREFLDKLPKWDGVKRLETLFIDYFNSNDEEYTRAVTRKVFIGAVARVMKPGIKFDWMLVLNGPPGIGKSTIIERLATEWFNDSLRLSDTKDKTAAEKLQGYWILEIGELAGMSKVEENILKNFLSSQNDIYRASFGRRATPHPRQCIFIGTTNEERGYLRDTTGNRRFWPLKVYETDKKPWDMTDEEVMQIWAEAKVYFEANEDLQLPPELEKRANELQNEAMEADDRQGIVESYLEMLLPKDWNSFDINKRREYINEYYNDDSIIPKGDIPRETVSVIEIWCEAFGKNKADLERFKSFEITKMLRRIPCWVQDPKQKWNKLYGNTRTFKRVKF